MTFDLQRTLHALHWGANARSHPGTPQINQSDLAHARELFLTGDPAAAIECVQVDRNWENDPRAWRLIGLCSQAIARYEQDPERRKALHRMSEQAALIDRARRVTETAEADVNLASTLIDQNRYAEALDIAKRACVTDPRLPTAHVAVLAIHIRLHKSEETVEYLRYLEEHEAWIFDDPVFCDHVSTDPDLVGLADSISSLKRSRQ